MESLFELSDATLRIALCAIDAGAAFVIIGLMQRLTPHACFTGSPHAKWAMTRRVIYTLVAAALFTKGVWRFDRAANVDVVEFVSQAGIIMGVLVFAVLRAFDVTTQDEFSEHKRVSPISRSD